MKLLAFRFSPVFYAVSSTVFVFAYAFCVAAYGTKIPSLAYIGLGNMLLAIAATVMFLKRNKKSR